MTTVKTEAGRTVIAHPNRLTVLHQSVQQLSLRADLTDDEARQIAQALWPDRQAVEPRAAWDVLREAADLLDHEELGAGDGARVLAIDLERKAAKKATPEPEALSDLDRRALAARNAYNGREDDRGAGDFTRSCVWGALLGLVVWSVLIVGVWAVLR